MTVETELEQLQEAVELFSKKMIAKLAYKMGNGYSGWKNKANRKEILYKLHNNVNHKDWVDVANLAMMLHWFQEHSGD